GVHVRIPFGDVESGFARADHIREDHFETQFISHCQMEPYAVAANFQTSGELEVWVPNASPFTRKRALSNLLRLPMDNVRVHHVFIGGHFGGRSELISGDYCASLLSMKTGRPVRLTYTREETLCNTRQKHAFAMNVRTGVRRDGTLVAQSIQVVADGGAYISTGAIAVTVPAVMLLSVYRVPDFLYEARRVYTNKPPCGAMRGHGNQQLRFAIERQMDMIASDLGLDPVEVRLKNAVQAGDVLPYGSKVFSCGLQESVLEAVRASGWDRKAATEQPPGGPGRGLGLGVASIISGFSMGVRTLSGAFVKFNEDAQATLLTGIVDNGQGNETMAAQIAAEVLGVEVGDVRVINADTATTPQDPGSYSMQSTFTGGNAVMAAAVDARRQILEIAAEKLEANPADLDLRDQRVFVKGSPERAIGLRDVIWSGLASGRPVLGRGHYMPSVDSVDWYRGRIEGQMTGAYTFGTTIAEVEVDRETGQVAVLEVVAAHDCGRAINPMLVEGQTEGSVPLGQGQALTEDVVQRDGQVLNPGFATYFLPTAADAPRVKSIIVETVDPNGPFGAKEAAESIKIAIVPALASAVEQAVGANIQTLPITPEKVLAALEQGAKE
ncbi:MAG: molybdopterin-dependent oxidoreductase, partial [Dehalococcoidia bacterium]|nr:molybdopterin-dependent oxidoreductase [Dehalococcoidia bacterium]